MGAFSSSQYGQTVGAVFEVPAWTCQFLMRAMEIAFPSQVYRKYEVNGIKQVLTSIFGSFC